MHKTYKTHGTCSTQIDFDIEEFKSICDNIVSNRLSKEFFDVEDKIYTRDLYTRD